MLNVTDQVFVKNPSPSGPLNTQAWHPESGQFALKHEDILGLIVGNAMCITLQ